LLKGKKTYERDKNLCVCLLSTSQQQQQKKHAEEEKNTQKKISSLFLSTSLFACTSPSSFSPSLTSYSSHTKTQADNSNRNNRSVVRCKSAPRV
jgi:hypothetical protein